MKKNIVIIGNYGAGNLGDDLLLLGTLKVLKNAYKERDDIHLTVLSAQSEPISTIQIVAKIIPSNWEISYLSILPTGIRSYLKGLFGATSKTKSAIKNADLIIFGGGGLLNPEESRSIAIWGHQIQAAQKLAPNAFITLIGQSFPKLAQSHCHNKLFKLLTIPDLIIVRDPNSEKNLKELFKTSYHRNRIIPHLKRSSDLALLLNTELTELLKNDEHNKKNHLNNYFALNLRSYNKIDQQKLFSVANTIVSEITEHTGAKIILFPYAKEDQKQLISFYNQLTEETQKKCKVANELNLVETLNLINNSLGVISMRLHGLITAICLKKKVLALSYSSKVNSEINPQEEIQTIELCDEKLDMQEIVSTTQKFLKQNEPEKLDSQGSLEYYSSFLPNLD